MHRLWIIDCGGNAGVPQRLLQAPTSIGLDSVLRPGGNMPRRHDGRFNEIGELVRILFCDFVATARFLLL